VAANFERLLASSRLKFVSIESAHRPQCLKEDGIPPTKESSIQHLLKEPKEPQKPQRVWAPVSFSWLIMSKVAINSKTFLSYVLKRAK